MSPEEQAAFRKILKLEGRAAIIGRVGDYAGNLAMAVMGLSISVPLHRDLPPGLFDAGQITAVPLYAMNCGACALANSLHDQAENIRNTQLDVPQEAP